jgi:putative glutamine amidotransferase
MKHDLSPMRPLVGISCCSKAFGVFNMPNHAASDTYVRATEQLVGAVPVLIPASGAPLCVRSLLARIDGLLLTGSRSNVQPSLYEGPPHPDGVPEDPDRDGVTMPLIRAAIAAGMPVLAICRGLQELNVALGGSLHQRLQDLHDRMDHSTAMQPDARVRQAKAHTVRVVTGSWLHRMANGAAEIPVNSLHNQGIDRLAGGMVVEGVAPDGTIEAVRVVSTERGIARGFAVGVQWHPENDFETDTVSARIFTDFGDAVRAYADGVRRAAPGLSAVAD